MGLYCHEGNIGMENILSGARSDEKANPALLNMRAVRKAQGEGVGGEAVRGNWKSVSRSCAAYTPNTYFFLL